MKVTTLMLLVSAVGIALHLQEIRDRLTAFHAKTRWYEDDEQARSEAKSENKFVLLRFTGSDWCGVCKALDREVLSTDEFKEMADENFVLVDVDYPRHKSQPAALMAQNAQLGRQYGITGVPTVVVLNSNGVVVRQLGYHPGAPGDFLAELKRFRRVASQP